MTRIEIIKGSPVTSFVTLGSSDGTVERVPIETRGLALIVQGLQTDSSDADVQLAYDSAEKVFNAGGCSLPDYRATIERIRELSGRANSYERIDSP